MIAQIPFTLTDQEKNVYSKYASLLLPRHTSYPAAPFWSSYSSIKDPATKSLDQEHFLAPIRKNQSPISLYIHVPYCQSLCFYCGCTKDIYNTERMTKNDPRGKFLEHLKIEIEQYSKSLGSVIVEQIHLGGGTPTFLTPAQLETLFQFIRKNFNISSEAEIAIEIDPRVTNDQHLDAMKCLGVNRVSLGVQDFDEKVQKVVNRIQPYEMVSEFVKKCRDRGFDLNFDLIYGLPFQTKESIQKTVEQVLTLRPDRIAYYRLALLPSMFKWQKVFSHADLPDEEQLLDINLLAINQFIAGGYAFIGLDHFALKNDRLYKEWSDRRLRRNFQGMSTRGDLDIIGLGPSAISQFATGYLQNHRTPKEWFEGINSGTVVHKYHYFGRDDLIRRDIINQLYCYGRIDKKDFEQKWQVPFNDYFSKERVAMDRLCADGLCQDSHESFSADSFLTRLLIRVVASTFDKYYQEELEQKDKSQTVFSRL